MVRVQKHTLHGSLPFFNFTYAQFEIHTHDILPNTIQFIIIADDMVIKTGLPGKIVSLCFYLDGANSFILIDNHPQ